MLNLSHIAAKITMSDIRNMYLIECQMILSFRMGLFKYQWKKQHDWQCKCCWNVCVQGQWPPSLFLSLSQGAFSLSRGFEMIMCTFAKQSLIFRFECAREFDLCVFDLSSVLCWCSSLSFQQCLIHMRSGRRASEDSVWGKTSREDGGVCVLCWSRVCACMVALFAQMLVLTQWWNFQCAKTPASSELNTSAHPSVLMQMRVCVCVIEYG